jgi:hypothetical protein
MKKYLSINNCSRSKKFALFSLFLDIILDCRPFFDMTDLLPDLAQRISTDLTNDGNLSDVCKGWSECLPKVEHLDGDIHQKMMNRLRLHLVNVKPEACFEVFLAKANVLSKDVSEIIFSRGILILNEKTETNLLKGLLKKGKEFLGYANDSRSRNLATAFNECITKTKCYELECPEVFKVVTDHPSVSNFMKFFPKLQELKLLSSEVAENAKWILKQIAEFLERLDEGVLTFETFGLLKDTERVERLLSLHESIQEMKKEPGATHTIKTQITLRLKETEEFFNAKNELNIFKSKFNLSRKTQVALDRLMRPFSFNSSVYFLKSFCEIRPAPLLPVVLKLGLITPEHRQIVSRFNALFNESSVFRQIHKTVVMDEETRQNENDPNESFGEEEVDSDDDNEDIACWEEVIGAAKEMFDQFEDFVKRLSRLETSIAEVNRRFKVIHEKERLHEELIFMERSVKQVKKILPLKKQIFGLVLLFLDNK